MDAMNFKIIGGGIAGLASALAVANSGHSATIFERAAQFENIGAGLQLGPNAARALQQLGAWDAVKKITFAPAAIYIRDGKSGKILKKLSLGKSFEQRYGLPYLSAHRADLHSALFDVVKVKSNIEVKTDSEVSDLSADGFDGVIAADGAQSRIRDLLFPGNTAITTPDIYFRCLFTLPPSISEVDFETINLWLFAGGHVVHYPVGNPLKLNLIAITQGEVPEKHFNNACTSLQEILSLAQTFTRWNSAYVPPLETWCKNNVCPADGAEGRHDGVPDVFADEHCDSAEPCVENR